MNVSLDQLRYFLAAARHEHIGRAARSIPISASVVSNAVTTLEAELGCELFERRQRRIFLTATGQRMRDEAEQILARVDTLPSVLNQRQVFQGHCRIAASHFLASNFLATGWHHVQNMHPKLQGELLSMSTVEVLAEIQRGRVDLGLCFSPLKHPDLHSSIVHKGQLRLAVRRGHPVRKLPKAQRPRRLSEYPASLHKAAEGVDLCERHPMFEANGLEPQITSVWDNDSTAVRLLRQSDAWSLLPDIVIETNSRYICALETPKFWDAPYQIDAITRAERCAEPLLAALTESLQASFEKSTH